MKIAEFARAGGVGVETVRYYQRRGLLPKPDARHQRQREYAPALVQRLIFIRRLQSAGFTLREIEELIRLDRTSERLRVQQIAGEKVRTLGEQIRELQSVVKSLQRLLHDCEHTAAGTPCPIIEAFDPGAGDRPDSQ